MLGFFLTSSELTFSGFYSNETFCFFKCIQMMRGRSLMLRCFLHSTTKENCPFVVLTYVGLTISEFVILSFVITLKHTFQENTHSSTQAKYSTLYLTVQYSIVQYIAHIGGKCIKQWCTSQFTVENHFLLTTVNWLLNGNTLKGCTIVPECFHRKENTLPFTQNKYCFFSNRVVVVVVVLVIVIVIVVCVSSLS